MKKLTTEEFIVRAKALYGDKYDYSQTQYVDMRTNVTIICPKHGPFQQLPSNHLKNCGGCILCNKVEGRRMTTSDFITRAKVSHDVDYDYSKVEYVNNRTPVCIGCKIHGDFWQAPYKHLTGQGCPKCAKNYKDDTVSFIEKARKVHGDLYDYSRVEYVDQHTKVCIIDPEYGEFWQQPNSHLNGRGSPMRRGERTLKTRQANNNLNPCEERVFELLTSRFGDSDVVREYRSERYPFPCDFYVKSLDLYIELNFCAQHGRHWFDPMSSQDQARLAELSKKAANSQWYQVCITTWTRRDPVKREIALQNDLNYLVFWDMKLTDFMAWYSAFDPAHPVLRNV